MRVKLMLATIIMVPFLAEGHEYLSFDELSEAFAWDLENAQITSETVAPGLHVLFGTGGNLLASIGDQGVLIVDSQFPQMIPRIVQAIEELGGDGIDFTINTHWHFDHSDGNPVLGRAGTWLVAQENSRRMMVGEHAIDLVSLVYKQPPYPAEALPVMTFDDRMQFHLNGETIDLLHFGPAHTTGDAAVYFRGGNVVHMGDVFNAGYPFIDAGNGGDLDGMISFCEEVLQLLNEDSIVIPGHGPVLGYQDLADYVDMLATVRHRISTLIDSGGSLEDVLAAAPTAEFDARYGNPGRLIDRAYASLSR